MGEKLLRAKDLQERLALSAASVSRLLHSGELPVIRLRGGLRVRPADLEAYLRRCTVKGRPGRKRTRYVHFEDEMTASPAVRRLDS
jgi:excisionase family DNA binding protein